MTDRNFILSVFIFAVLLLGSAQQFRNLYLIVSPLCADFSKILNNIYKITR